MIELFFCIFIFFWILMTNLPDGYEEMNKSLTEIQNKIEIMKNENAQSLKKARELENEQKNA